MRTIQATYSTISIQSNSYLGSHFELIWNELKLNQFNLLIADTGMGKTEFAKKLFSNELFENIIFISPLEIIVREITHDLSQSNELCVVNSLEDFSMVEFSIAANPLKKITVCTFHHFCKHIFELRNVDLLVVDEAHWLHNYSFTEVAGKMVFAIEQMKKQKCTILGLTATGDLLKLGSEWFEIDNIVEIQLDECKIPPRKVYLYPKLGKNSECISNTLLVKHYLENYVLEKEKVLIVVDGGNDNNTIFANFVNSVKSIVGINCDSIDFQKSENKMENNNVLSLIRKKQFTQSTEIFLATNWISNGLNIYDVDLKHIIVVSNRWSVVKQTMSRLRIKSQANLVLFQQPLSADKSMYFPWEIVNEYLQSMKYGVELSEELELKFQRQLKWLRQFQLVQCIEFGLNSGIIYNAVILLEKWFKLNEMKQFADLGLIKEKLTEEFKVEIETIGEELIGKDFNCKELKIQKQNWGFDLKGISHDAFCATFGMKCDNENRELFTKKQIEKQCKTLGRDIRDIKSQYDHNRNLKYYFE